MVITPSVGAKYQYKEEAMKLVLKERGFEVPLEYREKAALLIEEVNILTKGLASAISVPRGAEHQAEARNRVATLNHCGDRLLMEVVGALGMNKMDYAYWEFAKMGEVLLGRRYEFEED